MSGAEIARAARGYCGVPWRHSGRGPGGLDCVGLVLAALRDAGAPVEDVARYPKGERGDSLAAALGARGFRRVLPLAAVAEGDVLTFSDGRYAAHLGIRSTWRGVPAVIHAHALRRRVLEEPLEAELAEALRQVWRAPGVEG